MTLSGGCECGSVRYQLASEPITVNCCHCRDCQTITGSAFALNGMIETDRIVVTAGEPAMRDLHRGEHVTRAWRCATCETLLWADHPMLGDAVRFVRLGTLDTPEALSPDAHYFVRSRLPWVTIPDGVPTFETLPTEGIGPPLPPDRAERQRAAFAETSRG